MTNTSARVSGALTRPGRMSLHMNELDELQRRRPCSLFCKAAEARFGKLVAVKPAWDMGREASGAESMAAEPTERVVDPR